MKPILLYLFAAFLIYSACNSSSADIKPNDSAKAIIKIPVNTTTDTFSFDCEQGLFLTITGSHIFGAVCFTPNTGSCLFVFKGDKKEGIYNIECADYNDAQLQSGNLTYSIKGWMQVDTTAKEVKFMLNKNPDACMRAFGVPLTDTVSFDINSLAAKITRSIGIIKKDLNLEHPVNGINTRLGKFAIVKITSDSLSFYNVTSYVDDKNTDGQIKKEDVLVVK
jgi:hypothetical protein